MEGEVGSTDQEGEDYHMPTYQLAVCYSADAQQPPAGELAQIMADVVALQHEMAKAGVWVFSGGLHAASTATVVTDQAGRIVMTDGPFIEAKEQIGGLSIIDVPDLDAALLWAGRLAQAVTTPIEVRPFVHAAVPGPES